MNADANNDLRNATDSHHDSNSDNGNDSDSEPPGLHAFAGYGIELEYMIVDRERLDVLPVADRLLRNEAGGQGNEVRRGALGWSNELVLHVLEIKNLRPDPSLSLLPAAFQEEVREINRRLQPMGARLMPGAMHPWMDPRTETRLWPHDNDAIYRAYDRIFNSRSHGWANLQSMHINLPFCGDGEFARLHAAVRLVLPILPALAASSPLAEGRATGFADYRMQVYADNAEGIPSIAGMVVPETVTSRAAYEQRILAPMYRDIAPHDPDGVLQEEWLNSRGAIARFDRSAIEIRVVDTQECPAADLAIAAATVAVVERLYRCSGRESAADENHANEATLVAQQEMPITGLHRILHDCIRDADAAVISHPAYLRLLDYPGNQCTAAQLWRHLIGRMLDENRDGQASRWEAALSVLLEQGPLARRILRATGDAPSIDRLREVYASLCDCLEQGHMFEGMR